MSEDPHYEVDKLILYPAAGSKKQVVGGAVIEVIERSGQWYYRVRPAGLWQKPNGRSFAPHPDDRWLSEAVLDGARRKVPSTNH